MYRYILTNVTCHRKVYIGGYCKVYIVGINDDSSECQTLKSVLV